MASLQPSPAALDRPEVHVDGRDEPAAPLLVLAATKTATYTAGRARAPRGLTATGVLFIGAIVVAAGSAIDMMIGRGPGLGLTLSFLLAGAAMALCLPLRLLAAGIIAAPLLFAAATTAIAYVAGDAQGARQLALEVATSLALTAPVLFGGTGLTVAIALGRLIKRVGRRSA